jgi:type VI secretion system protein ImpJ
MEFLPVHWEEGMFLRPHHLQAAQRHAAGRAAAAEKWDIHYNWGLRSVRINRDALANSRFEVDSLRARLRDGTLLSVPEECALPPLDLKPLLQGGQKRTVYLALPRFNPSRNNVPLPGQDAAVRYAVDAIRYEDENTGVNPQPIRFRRPNARLLVDGQDQAGFEAIPLGRVERSAEATAVPRLDPAYFPPVLACDAWDDLSRGLVQEVYHRLGRKIERLAAQALSRRVAFEGATRGAALLFAQLREMNQAYATLGVLAFAEGVHPLAAYLELARLVGQLAIFDAEARRPPELPRYDHDDLGGCFHRLRRHIDALLDAVVEPDYKERPFIGAGYRMQIQELEPAWLDSGWEMYIGVQSPLERAQCVELLTDSGQLDMKVGGARRVETIYRQRFPGLRFTHEPNPTPSLPRRPGLIYFQVDRDAEPEEWRQVVESRSLAIRVNDRYIVGDIQDRTAVAIRTAGGQEIGIEFTLYVVAKGAGRGPADGDGA